MKKQPLFYDKDRPYAHYQAAGKLRKEAEAFIKFGKIFPFAALPLGIACIVFEPLAMALFTLFGVFFTVFAVLGCSIRNIKFAMASIPFALASALVTIFAKSEFSLIGAAFYIIAVFVQFKVIWALSTLGILKELPGFPFFDPAMDDISFAAIEYHGGDEYIEGELVEERTERAKIVPAEPPSEDMSEIAADDIEAAAPLLEDSFQPLDSKPYERMVNAQTPDKNDVSDIDLLY